MASDVVKNLVKRRVGIAPGRPWIPWDEIDFVLGAFALIWGAAVLSWSDLVTILLLGVAGHVLVNRLGYWLGILDVRW